MTFAELVTIINKKAESKEQANATRQRTRVNRRKRKEAIGL
jgi:hypothetical protein